MKTRTKILIGALVVLLIAAGGGLYVFFHHDTPAPANKAAAAKGIATTTTGASDRSTTATGINGTWAIQKTARAFDFGTTDTGTFVGFRINEKLATIGSTTAVGRTRDATGSMTIAGNSVSAATFKVDLTTITTNNSQRNRRVQQALETDQFPIATFKLTQPITLPADASSGGNVNVDAIGDLTLHGVTKHVTFPLQAQLVNGEVAVAGSMNVTFSDYGVAVPQSQIVLSVDDHGILELQMQLKRT